MGLSSSRECGICQNRKECEKGSHPKGDWCESHNRYYSSWCQICSDEYKEEKYREKKLEEEKEREIER
jgi:hypothetical protein